MTILEGQYFSGVHPESVPASLTVETTQVVLATGEINESMAIEQIRVSPRIGSTARFITLPNGGQFGCDDTPLLDRLPQESPAEGVVAWLEQRLYVALTCVAVIVILLSAGYFVGLPAAARHIAARLPIETERALGEEVQSYLEVKRWLEGSGIPHERQKEIRTGFDRLISDLPYRNHYELNFRASKVLGPNALALPGGIILITDQMVEMAVTDEEVWAVLAHEVGHVELHHTTRSIMQNSAVGVVAATITSDAASLSAAVVGLPMLVAKTKYSRTFESEADQFAFQLLERKGHSPAAFATLMERLDNSKEMDLAGFAWISTHPVTADRIARAREASSK